MNQDIAHFFARIQAGVGILKDDLHPFSISPHVGCTQTHYIGSTKTHGAVCCVLQPQDRAAHGRFTRTAFSDKAHDLARLNVE